jgi:hypothetical protein
MLDASRGVETSLVKGSEALDCDSPRVSLRLEGDNATNVCGRKGLYTVCVMQEGAMQVEIEQYLTGATGQVEFKPHRSCCAE